MGLNWMVVIVLTKLPRAHFHCQCIDVNTLTKIQQLEHTPENLLIVSGCSLTEHFSVAVGYFDLLVFAGCSAHCNRT